MNSKLTLTVNESVVRKAKRYAKKEKRTLSDIVENYLNILTNDENIESDDEPTSVIELLRGSFKLPADFDYRIELDKRLSEKYLK
jgi:hypothetical protein